jgi:hypothetical protein
MKEDLFTTMQSLIARMEQLTEKSKMHGEVAAKIKQIRQKAVTECLAELLPNLNPWSIEALKNEVPDFPIPTTTYFFGIFERIDPNTSIDSLRSDLEKYLEAAPVDTSKIWEKRVGYYNRASLDFEENFIRPNETEITEIQVQINRLMIGAGKDVGCQGVYQD